MQYIRFWGTEEYKYVFNDTGADIWTTTHGQYCNRIYTGISDVTYNPFLPLNKNVNFFRLALDNTNMIKQFTIITSFAILAFSVNILFEKICDGLLLQLILSGLLYVVLSVLIVFLFPKTLISSSREELLGLFNKTFIK